MDGFDGGYDSEEEYEPDPYAPAWWAPLADSPAALEAPHIAAGEPWTVSAVAGLQFYDWRQDDGLGGQHEPQPGDRLNLVREPANRRDPNAVRVEWRNGVMLGHLARDLAQDVAPALDRGEALRAYVLTLDAPGRARAWGLRALFVGQPVAPRLKRWTTRGALLLAADVFGERRQECRDGRTVLHEERRPPSARQYSALMAWKRRVFEARVHRKADAAFAFAPLLRLRPAMAAADALESMDDPFTEGAL